MANRDCEGDFFETDGRMYYRCMWDGSVIPRPDPGQTCPMCEREIAGQDHGKVPVKTRRYVVLPGTGWEVTLS